MRLRPINLKDKSATEAAISPLVYLGIGVFVLVLVIAGVMKFGLIEKVKNWFPNYNQTIDVGDGNGDDVVIDDDEDDVEVEARNIIILEFTEGVQDYAYFIYDDQIEGLKFGISINRGPFFGWYSDLMDYPTLIESNDVSEDDKQFITDIVNAESFELAVIEIADAAANANVILYKGTYEDRKVQKGEESDTLAIKYIKSYLLS